MGNPLNVWVLEDEPAIRNGVKRVLEDHRGHTVVEFGTVKQVLDALELLDCGNKLDCLPHVFVSDMNLPDGTCDIAVRRAKELGVKRFVLMTGRPDDNRKIAEELGIKPLAKPFDLNVLADRVESTN